MDVKHITVENRERRRQPGSEATRVRRTRAYTLTELMLVVAIVGVITMIGFPAYSQHVERSKVSQAIADIMELSLLAERYHSDNFAYPENLAAIGSAGRLDPWGRPYAYLNIQTGGTAKARKNKKLVPINSDFDLYSQGKDGDSSSPLTAKSSYDDVVRANDGRFVGLASNYTQ